MKSRRETLAAAPKYRRLKAAGGGVAAVDRKGGKYKAGVVRRASIITKGEALGHGVWLDDEFVDSVQAGINRRNNGVKSRYTHPSMSADGLGTHLGRAMDAERRGDQIVADVHFTRSSHATPDGDLSGHVMDMAEESPEDVAISIVYAIDDEAEREHFISHGGKIVEERGFEVWDDSEFVSPDPANVANLPHARLAELRAADFVGDPAANPDGLFGREARFAEEADALARYALGLSTQRPTAAALSIDADRVRQFVNRFLTHNGLEVKKVKPMNDEPALADDAIPTDGAPVEVEKKDPQTPVEETLPAAVAAASRAEAAKFRAAFGDSGAVWYAEGLSWDAAIERHRKEQEAKQAAAQQALEDRLAAIEARLGAGRKAGGEQTPVHFQPADQQRGRGRGFASKINIVGVSNKAAK